jgi:hypothetical protein
MSSFVETVGMRCYAGDATEPTRSDRSIDLDDTCLFDFESLFNERKRLVSMIECLWDTYINNKNLVLTLLLKLNKRVFEENVRKNKIKSIHLI